MCSSYIINGKRCQSGGDLAEAIGIENARLVNRNFVPGLPEDDWLMSCLCHVNRSALHRVTGVRFRMDWQRDAFVPVKPRTA